MTTPVATDPTADDLGITPRDVDQLCVDTIRMLAVDMVNAANSGHPGMPLGAADMAYVLWTKFLRYDADDPEWRDRDRFVLSAGHGSALLYALLHLSGYDLPLEELRNFRQLHSRTPGHPERGVTPGVEVTTGPLGQGFANGVGIALGQKMLHAEFGDISRHRTFGIVSDGDLMEGVAAEAASLAGHLGLGELVYLYDDNSISIDGSTDVAFTEDVAARFGAYGWHVLSCDGHDRAAIAAALDEAVAETARPSLICCRTIIGRGAPTVGGTAGSHGAPLGAKETPGTKEFYGWPQEPTFLVPREVRERFAVRAREGRAARGFWDECLAGWRESDPEEAARWEGYWTGTLPDAETLLGDLLADWDAGTNATRKHSGAVLQKLAARAPNLVGGSADLAGSNCTTLKGSPWIGPNDGESFTGRNVHFGVREHAMGAIVNGLAAHGAWTPYCATFLAFLDYMRAPVRLASLSGHGSVFVYTHDSIGLGEDGPTHQPIEHLWSLRVIPGITVHRPADGPETAAAWADAVSRRDGPTAIILTRQKLPAIEPPAGFRPADLLRGAYVAAEAGSGDPDVVIIATGSEVSVGLAARELLEQRGIATRVVSMPSVELFDRQDDAWKESVLPEDRKRVAIEAGRPDGWYRFVGRDGLVIGIEGFGHSAPAAEVFEQFGFTGAAVAARVEEWWPGR